MARRETAQIIIQIRGGLQAAAEARRTASSMDELGDQTQQASRAAVVCSGALTVLSRQVRDLARDEILAVASSIALTGALTALGVAALGVASVALPALAIALWNVIAAAGVWTAALVGGMLGMTAAAGLMVAGVVGRFKLLSDVAGTAANDLRDRVMRLRDAFLDVTAAGADRLMSGLADMMHSLLPLVQSLEGSFTRIGEALGDMFRGLGRELAGMGPELRAMFDQLPGVIRATTPLLVSLIDLFVRLATVGAPVLADALRTVAAWMQGWTEALTTDRIEDAKNTLIGFGRGIATFFSALAEPLQGIFGPAMDEMGSHADRILVPLGNVIGTLLAGFIQVGRIVMPAVVRGFELLAGVMNRKAGPALQGLDIDRLAGALVKAVEWLATAISEHVIPAFQAIGRTAEKVFPFIENVLWPLIKGIVEGMLPAIDMFATALGWIGEKAEPLRGIFNTVGRIIGFLFPGWVFRAAGSVLKFVPIIGKVLGPAVTQVGRVIQGAGRVIAGVFGFIWRRGKWVVEKIVGVLDDLALRLGETATNVWVAAQRIGARIIEGISTAVSKVLQIGADIAVGIVNALTSAVEWVFDAAKNVGKAIFDGVKEGAGDAFGFLGDVLGHAPGGGPFALIDAIQRGVTGNATGGVMPMGGLSIVGERGPELVYLPPQSTVFPTGPSRHFMKRALTSGDYRLLRAPDDRAPAPSQAVAQRPTELVQHTHVHLDAREIARSVDRVRLDELGRDE